MTLYTHFMHKISLIVILIFIINPQTFACHLDFEQYFMYHSFAAHNQIGGKDEQMNVNWLVEAINKEDWDSDQSSYTVMLGLLLKLDKKQGLKLGNKIIKKLTRESYYFEDIITLLARYGYAYVDNIQYQENFNEYDKMEVLEYSALAGNYLPASDYFAKQFQGEEYIDFNFIGPFIIDKSPYKDQVVKRLVLDLKSSNKQIQENALDILLNYPNTWSEYVVNAINAVILQQLNSINYSKIKKGLYSSQRWGVLGELTDEIRAKIIKLTLISNNHFWDESQSDNFELTVNEVATYLKLLIPIYSYEDKVNLGIMTSCDWIEDDEYRYFLETKFSKVWRFHFNEISSIVEFTNRIERFKNSDKKDLIKKLKHLIKLKRFKELSVYSKIEIANNIKSYLPKDYKKIIKKTYSQVSVIEQSYLINQYPKYFKFNKKKWLKTSQKLNYWSQLAIWINLTNFKGQLPQLDYTEKSKNKATVLQFIEKLKNREIKDEF